MSTYISKNTVKKLVRNSLDKTIEIESVTNIKSVNSRFEILCRMDNKKKRICLELADKYTEDMFDNCVSALRFGNQVSASFQPKILFETKFPDYEYLHTPYYIVEVEDYPTALSGIDQWTRNNVLKFLSSAGELLANIHDVGTSSCGYMHNEETAHSKQNRIDKMSESEQKDWEILVEKKARTLFSDRFYRFRDIDERIIDVISDAHIPEINNPSLLHMDYWWGNIRVKDTYASKIRSWWRGFSGDPLLNIASAEYMIVRTRNLPVEERSAIAVFREGYSKHRNVEWRFFSRDLWRAYQMYVRIRALRSFDYWYRNLPDEEIAQKHKELVRDIHRIHQGDILGRSPSDSPLVQ